ncbi:EAL domain-containing protein [Pseudoduganella umbonata]|uniref:EAL domain-containing protein n=1 Tax=Pseudoduganella umbonata TaxID=864828 RepID=A0A4P8HLB0_9BURK|nr:EAL domain-containing protein [Pseudoduganella umbonata]MBB3224891.1 sensor c-di-GMP phosphodiesterase-like protein [Pseudoduganella umbonata]QCP09174.1 EAL domain-containing protein [Pseudoduganella umbonata]
MRMADAMGLHVIAEGVENVEQAEFLRANGVQYAQGWLFSRAIPFDELCRALDGAAAARGDQRLADRVGER